MNNKYKYFLAVAEELNMSRAAERTFISHQGISNAIRQLENEFGVILFNRSPKFSPTPECETMVRILRQISMLENNLEAQLHTCDKSYSGTFQIGITSSNYDALVPDMVAGFIGRYPCATLEVEPDFSINLEKKLLKGDIDMYIGAGHITTDITKLIPLITESYFFVCSAKILKEQFKENYSEAVARRCQGSNLKDFDNFAMINYPANDKLQQSIDACAQVARITFRKVFECADSNVIVKLAAKSLGGGIITDFAIPTVLLCNAHSSPDDYLYIFPLTDLVTDCDEISLAYHPDMYLSRYHLDFIDIICGAVDSFKPEIHKMILSNNTGIG